MREFYLDYNGCQITGPDLERLFNQRHNELRRMDAVLYGAWRLSREAWRAAAISGWVVAIAMAVLWAVCK